MIASVVRSMAADDHLDFENVKSDVIHANMEVIGTALLYSYTNMRIRRALGLALSFASSIFASNFTNPLKSPLGSDPFIVYWDGFYYLTTTTYSNIQLTRATTLEGLKTGENKVIWTPDDPSRYCDLWAPELHNLNGV